MGRSQKKQAKHAKKVLGFYQRAFGLEQPYQLILHGGFIQHCLEQNVYFREQLIELHDGPVTMHVTSQTRQELRKLGPSHDGAAVVCKRLMPISFHAPTDSEEDEEELEWRRLHEEEQPWEDDEADMYDGEGEGDEEGAGMRLSEKRSAGQRKRRALAAYKAKEQTRLAEKAEAAKHPDPAFASSNHALRCMMREQPGQYILVVQDGPLRQQLRRIPGVPIIFVDEGSGQLRFEQPSSSSERAAAKVETSKQVASDAERKLFGGQLVDILDKAAQEGQLKKRKQKGVNPLAAKKKQKTAAAEDEPASEVEQTETGEGRRVRQRERQRRRVRTRARHEKAELESESGSSEDEKGEQGEEVVRMDEDSGEESMEKEAAAAANREAEEWAAEALAEAMAAHPAMGTIKEAMETHPAMGIRKLVTLLMDESPELAKAGPKGVKQLIKKLKQAGGKPAAPAVAGAETDEDEQDDIAAEVDMADNDDDEESASKPPWERADTMQCHCFLSPRTDAYGADKRHFERGPTAKYPDRQRKFFCCGKPLADRQRCGFFAWAEAPADLGELARQQAVVEAAKKAAEVVKKMTLSEKLLAAAEEEGAVPKPLQVANAMASTADDLTGLTPAVALRKLRKLDRQITDLKAKAEVAGATLTAQQMEKLGREEAVKGMLMEAEKAAVKAAFAAPQLVINAPAVPAEAAGGEPAEGEEAGAESAAAEPAAAAAAAAAAEMKIHAPAAVAAAAAGAGSSFLAPAAGMDPVSIWYTSVAKWIQSSPNGGTGLGALGTAVPPPPGAPKLKKLILRAKHLRISPAGNVELV